MSRPKYRLPPSRWSHGHCGVVSHINVLSHRCKKEHVGQGYIEKSSQRVFGVVYHRHFGRVMRHGAAWRRVCMRDEMHERVVSH